MRAKVDKMGGNRFLVSTEGTPASAFAHANMRLSFAQVAYGEFTAEADTQTSFLCPELTVRQLKYKRAVRGVFQETVGRVHPALRNPDVHFPSKQKVLGPLLSRVGAGGDDPVWEGMVGVNGGTKRRKQELRVKEAFATTGNMPGRWLPSWKCGSEMVVGIATRVETPVEVVIRM